MERDVAAGLHVITGLLRESAASAAGMKIGSCIRMIDGIVVGGKTDSDLRKLIFGGLSDHVVLGLQLPQMTTLTEYMLSRSETLVFFVQNCHVKLRHADTMFVMTSAAQAVMHSISCAS